MTYRRRFSTRLGSYRRDGRRLISMVFMLVLLGAMINHARKPETWQWLADDVNRDQEEAVPAAQLAPAEPVRPAPPVPQPEELVPGPTDLDPEEWKAAEDQFRNLRDKQPLSEEEMPSYWRLFRWSRAQARTDLAQRAEKNPFFTQIWEQPRKYRGKPVSLKLHIRRVLSFDAPENNSAGVKTVYEMWGVTDESRQHLYAVLTDSIPEGFPEGAKVEADVRFTGYFLKILGYEASDAKRGAPLLIGKIHALPMHVIPIRHPQANRIEFWQTILIAMIGGCVIIALRFIPWPWKKAKPDVQEVLLQGNMNDAENWLSNPPPNPETKPNGNGPSGDKDRPGFNKPDNPFL